MYRSLPGARRGQGGWACGWPPGGLGRLSPSADPGRPRPTRRHARGICTRV